MATDINPQEIFLLERYTSLEYFGELRDTWEEMIRHLERCLNEFMRNLPLDYRNRPLPEQPDAVWGERVLPNFRSTFQSLCDGYIRLSHGDVGGLGAASGPMNDFKGQMDFWPGWMTKEDENIYRKFLNLAVRNAGNIQHTAGAHWNAGSLTVHYHPVRGPLNPPANWPMYRLVPSVKVATGAHTPQSGIYLPDVDNSCAEFLSANYDKAPKASVLIRIEDIIDPATNEKYDERPVHEKRPCIWTLVERISDTSSKSGMPSLLKPTAHRVPAGQPCPETGYYFTPAQQDSRRKFVQGDIMPELHALYGATIWQWDQTQG
ncbi:MAG TPA: hypothetical protein VGN04_07255 [Herbaspirillum sp.]|jgi:hypothetical protein